jgi:hypothetical protein
MMLVLCVLLAGCAAAEALVSDPSLELPGVALGKSSGAGACAETEALRLTPPADPAVFNEPAEGSYIANDDGSILVGAYWTEKEEYRLRAGENGNKVGWFRPAGAALEITGRRLDDDAPPMEAEVPCCYPTRFQASGLYFPAAGCWEVTARAAESELTFVVFVEEE